MTLTSFINNNYKTLLGIVLCCIAVIVGIYRNKKLRRKQTEVELLLNKKLQAVQAEIPQKKSSSKQNKTLHYEGLFLVGTNIPSRNGKLVSIRKQYHDRIAKIAQVIGKSEVSIFSYIDNVLSHHFETFQDEITAFYNKNNEDDYLTPKK